MRHVPDGELTALLDGALPELERADALDGRTAAEIVAHVESCEQCQRRLAVVGGHREDARAVLDASNPPAFPAAYDPLNEMSHIDRAARKRSLAPLAWAAMVVIAIGAGVWAVERSAPSVPAASTAAQRPVAGGAQRPAQTQHDALAEQAEAAGSALPTAPAPAAPAPVNAPVAAAEDAVAEEAVASPPVAAAEAAKGSVAATDAPVTTVRPAPAPAPAPPPPPAVAQRQAERAADSDSRRRLVPELRAVWGDRTPGGSVPDSAALDRLLGALRSVSAVSWSSDASQRPPAGAAFAPDAEIVDVAHAMISSGRLVRVTQRLADGRTVEVYSLTAQPGLALNQRMAPPDPRAGALALNESVATGYRATGGVVPAEFALPAQSGAAMLYHNGSDRAWALVTGPADVILRLEVFAGPAR